MKIIELVAIILSLISLVLGFVAKIILNAGILGTAPKTFIFISALFVIFAIYAYLKTKK